MTSVVQSTLPKEIRVSPNQNAKTISYLIKEFLLNAEKVDVVSGTAGAPISTRATENLVRLGYITYDNVVTDTSIINERRRTRLVLTVKKSKDFQKLYTENEEKRKLTKIREITKIRPINLNLNNLNNPNNPNKLNLLRKFKII